MHLSLLGWNCCRDPPTSRRRIWDALVVAQLNGGQAMDKAPDRNLKDVGHGVTKAALAAIPFVGGSLAEIFQLVIAPSLDKRRTKWLNGLAEAIEDLQGK